MSVVEKTEPSQTDSISFEFDLKHSPKKVWRALTEPELLTEWLFPVIGHKLEAGAAFKLKAPPQPGWDGNVDCRFVEIEPQKKMTWAWVTGDIDTVVTFVLTPTDAGTRLSIMQSGFKPHQKQNFGGARYGWKMVMGPKLLDVLERMS